MSDDSLGRAWETLEPTALQRRRMDGRVNDWLDAHDTSLVSEWLELFTLQPVSAAGLVAASVVSLATAPPLVWLLQSLM